MNLLRFVIALVVIGCTIVLCHFLYLVAKHPFKVAPHGPDDSNELGLKAYVGLLVLGAGIAGFGATHSLLYWIPSTWGGTQDGDWVSTRESISYFGAIAGVWIAQKLQDYCKAVAQAKYFETVSSELERLVNMLPDELASTEAAYDRKWRDESVKYPLDQAYGHLVGVVRNRIEMHRRANSNET